MPHHDRYEKSLSSRRRWMYVQYGTLTLLAVSTGVVVVLALTK